MSGWRLAIGIVLLLHGLGHALGVLALTGLQTDTWNGRSWLLTDRIGDTAAKSVSVVLWLVALATFVAAGLALLQLALPDDVWRPLAVTGAVASLVGLALFWNAFPVLFPNKVGALVVDVAVLVGVLLVDWPTEEMLTR